MSDRPRTTAWIERCVRSRRVRAGYTSSLVHLCGLLLLALLVPAPNRGPRPAALVLRLGEAGAEPAGGGAAEAVSIVPPVAAGQPAGLTAAPEVDRPPEPVPIDVSPPDLVADPAAADAAVREQAAGADRAGPFRGVALPSTRPSPSGPTGTGPGGPSAAFANRRGAGRARAARDRGGSAASEAAVDRGLAWLANHQGPDGSWRCDLGNTRCAGACRDAGTFPSTTAATGLALLPFLGAGHTHVAGDYQEVVSRGLYYLVSRIQPTPRGGDLCEGSMYGQGVATLALAEALGMTGDDMFVRPVTDAVRFIELAQDMHGGGWRYLPGQAGDMTVTAWQLAALKSSALAGVAVASPTFEAASRFLDRVQARRGELYGYQSPRPRPATSAVGLLCRIYTGWDRPDTIDRGLATLARSPPDPDAVYCNFYLAQALLLRDDPAWPKWNARTRDQLVARQSRVGHEHGSWSFADPETAPGGRLGHTALAILTLEVYYRLLPIYGVDVGENGF